MADDLFLKDSFNGDWIEGQHIGADGFGYWVDKNESIQPYGMFGPFLTVRAAVEAGKAFDAAHPEYAAGPPATYQATDPAGNIYTAVLPVPPIR
jgi:hypothetical protein